MLSLLTLSSVVVLSSLLSNKKISPKDCAIICDLVLKKIIEENFNDVDYEYLSSISVLRIISGYPTSKSDSLLAIAAQYVVKNSAGSATFDSYLVVDWAMGENCFSAGDVISFIDGNIDGCYSDDEIKKMSFLLNRLPEGTLNKDATVARLGRHVVDLMSEKSSDFIEISEAFSKVGYEEYDRASNGVSDLIQERLDDLGVLFDDQDILDIMENIDIRSELDDFWTNSTGGDETYSSGPSTTSFDEIDDLFDRG